MPSRRLPVAIRAYVPSRCQRRKRPRTPDSELVLVLDTETTVDPTQRLLFGSYRVLRGNRLVREGLIAADDLPAPERAILEAYVAEHADDGGGQIRLVSRAEFVEDVLWWIGYVGRAAIVGFNLPFDLSRLALEVTTARNGGFSLRLFESVDGSGRRWRHQWRPDITVKAYAAHRQFIAFAAPRKLDPENRVEGAPYRGRFIDLHTAVFALTDRSHTLGSAARAFGLPEGKQAVEGHGVITPAYIDYNRQDVRLTAQLYTAVREELARHPVGLSLEQAFSPASIGKAYLRTMRITPPLARPNVLRAETLGHAMTAYYGGRAEVRIRGVPVPVRYVDATSMYPTVFALQELWPWVIADHFEERDATDEARTLLGDATRESLLNPGAWPLLAGVLCRVRPDEDLLPVRAQYGFDPATRLGAPAWTIGLNVFSSAHDHWYMLADLLAAKVLSGKTPEILEAVRVAPVGVAAGLRPVALRGRIPVDPVTDDLFRRAIEERQRVKRDTALPQAERDGLAQFLKTVANGGSYGIFAEYHQKDPVAGRGVVIEAHGLWPIATRVHTPEEPGEYCFPPLAASVTAGARLLLALLQSGVEAAGGTYAACDTDSLLIVSSHEGGLVPCPGGAHGLPDGKDTARALSHAEVDVILAELDRLNPYDRSLVPSLIKVEAENVGPDDPDELMAYAISAKRYVLYRQSPDGTRRIVKPSSHGLGLYRAPHADPDGWDHDWPAWIEETWSDILAEAHGEPVLEREWHALPAISQLTVSSPRLLTPFREANRGRPYAEQVKPFSFMAAGHVDPLVPLPAGLERQGLVPVAPYAKNAGDALAAAWRNRRDGRPVQVTTKPGGERGKVRLKTHADVVDDYRWHPEYKSGDPRGRAAGRTSVGLLPRLHVVADGVPVHIGKESNQLEEEESGAIADPDEAVVGYRDERAEWEALLPALRRLRDERGWRSLAQASGLSERAVRYALNGGKVPRITARRRLLGLLLVRT